MPEVVTIKPFKTSESCFDNKNLKGIVPQQSEQKPKVEKDLPQRNSWV